MVLFFCLIRFSGLGQEALEDGVLGLLGGEAQGLPLQQLVAGDLADGGLVDELRLGGVCLLYTSRCV